MCYRIFTNLILITCLILLVRPAGFGQTVCHTRDPDIVQIKGLYSGYGKLFKPAQDLSTGPLHIKGSFLPADSDILKTERLMESQYAGIVRGDQRQKGLSPEDYRTYYYRYYRQYAGLINQDGNRVIYIMLFTCCKKIGRCYPDWKKELVSPLREDSCAVFNWYYVDLTAEKVIVY